MDASDSEDDNSEGEGEEREIRYVVGDVTRPQGASSDDAVVVHCIGELISPVPICQRKRAVHTTDDSGRWGKGGVFSAISARSLLPEQHYRLAGKMKG